MKTSRGLVASACLVPAILAPAMIATAGSAAAATGPALLRPSQLGTGYKAAPTEVEKASALNKGCKGLTIGKNDPLSLKVFEKETSATAGNIVLEIVLSTPSATAGASAFTNLEAHLTSCTAEISTDVKGKGKFAVTKAHAPTIAGAADSFALKSKFSTIETADGVTETYGGVSQQNVYLKGRYVVFVSGGSETAKETSKSITLTLGYGAGSQKLTAKAATAALKNI